jgi:hypothetical protein
VLGRTQPCWAGVMRLVGIVSAATGYHPSWPQDVHMTLTDSTCQGTTTRPIRLAIADATLTCEVTAIQTLAGPLQSI